VSKEIAAGIIIDRHFIYGNNENQIGLSDVEGLENIYTNVVEEFRKNFITEIDKYVYFPYKWIYRPLNNDAITYMYGGQFNFLYRQQGEVIWEKIAAERLKVIEEQHKEE
jgi:hypothetical protein